MNSTRLSLRGWPRAIFLLTALSGLLLFASSSSRAQVSVTATAGTLGPTTYTTLKGAFDAVNAGTHQGAISISITASTTETATAQLNSGSTAPASYTSVVVKPGATTNPVVGGSIASGPVVKLNGANNVTIDGSNNSTTSRNLSITNTSVTTPQVVVIGSVGTTPVTGDTLKNCILINGAQTSTALIVSDATVPGGAGYFNNITIRNNSIQKAYIGMYLITNVAAGNGSGTLVADNEVNTSGANAIRLCGIYVQGLSGCNVTNNTVGNFESTSAEFDRAIWLATSTTNATVSGNTVSGLSYTGATVGYAPIGINVSPGVTAANIDVSNNTINNISTTSSGTSIGIYFFSAASGITIQKNKVSNIKNTNTTGYGSAGIYLTGTLTTSAVLVANNFVWDVASYGANGFTAAENGNGIVVDGGGGYNIYHNTVALTTSQTLAGGQRSAALLITANVTAASSLNVRNNIFANLQTVGNANSRFAMVCVAPNSVFSALNYNDYYSASTNLTCRGGATPAAANATITNSIADVQANFGLNGASVSTLPNFTSATDLHLPDATNVALNNLGTPIAGITTDIDGQARNATTPDIGADEFLNCPLITFTQPQNASICAGGTASFTTTATNVTAYQWQVNTGTGWINLSNTAPYSGATTTTLTITGATTALNGAQYRAYATSACGADTSAARTLTVNAVPNAPTISSNSPLCAGGTINLTAANVTGGTFSWTGPLAYTSSVQNPTRPSATTAMSGTYTATVAVASCTSTVSSIIVTVNPVPQITTATGTNPSICGASDGSIALSGLAASTSYTVNYSKNGTGATPVTLISSATGVLTIPGLTSGAYTLITAAALGCTSPATTGTINLTDPAAPTQPSAITGPAIGCTGTAGTYSVNPVAGLTYIWTLPAGWSGTSTTASISATPGPGASAGLIKVKASNFCGSSIEQTLAVTVSATPPAPLFISGDANVCAGVSQIYSVTAVPGANTYNWTLPAGWSGASTSNSITVSPGPVGGSITVNASNTCGNSATVAKAVASNAVVNPAISISPSTPTTICAGTPVTFTAVSSGGGSAPQYHWTKNSVSTGNFSTSYTNNSLVSGDVIGLTLVSNAACALPSPSVSATPVLMTVQPLTPAGININANFSTAPVVCAGAIVYFVANATGTGTNPTYQWRRNGTPVGTNAPSYSSNAFINGDVVTCVLTSSANCPSPAVSTSNPVSLNVVANVVPAVTILASPDTSLGIGQPVTFTAVASGDGTSPAYQWYKNNVAIGGATAASYTTTTWAPGDQYHLRLISSAYCANPDVVTSNRLRMRISTGIGGKAGSLGGGLLISPNPNSGRFTLALTGMAGNLRTRIEILNTLGQVVYFREVIVDRKDWTLDIPLGAGIADGIYLLRLSAEDGSRATGRFELRR